MTIEIKAPKKLIEVALPLDDINAAAAREKSIRHGHPSTLHLWWARRPLAAARAVIFAQMVNDPGYERHLQRGMNKEKAQVERERLFNIIRKLVLWENTNNEDVLREAREEIWKSWRETCHLNRNHPDAAELFDPEKLPAFHDPFAGGGAIPLEAQRLGLDSYASDLNPVAVMINKAMIEIPPKFSGQKPVGPIPSSEKQAALSEDWSGAKGLAEDVRRYGHWMLEEAEKRIGHHYPKVKVTPEVVKERPDLKGYLGKDLTVIACLWARTVKSPNPAFSHVEVPLATSFILSSKRGKEAYVQPIIDGDSYRFKVCVGNVPPAAKTGTKAARGANFLCLLSGSAMDGVHIKSEGMAGRMGTKMLGIVAEGNRERIYLSPTPEMELAARAANPSWKPETNIAHDKRSMFTPLYGLSKFCDLFTPRQLMALTTFSDLLQEVREKAIADAIAAGMANDGIGLDSDGTGATAYGDALAVYLAFAIDKGANLWSTITSWMSDRGAFRETFARQAIPMVWDYAEANPFSNSGGNFASAVDKGRMAITSFPARSGGSATQMDAATQSISIAKVVSTDPPYYDNIGYADLSDYFYVWMRRGLKSVYPTLFGTLAAPKSDELVANPYRHGSKEAAEHFFLCGMTKAIHGLAEQAHPAFPVSIYYAFKQSDTKDVGTSNTGWETFLEAVIQAGFAIVGTWPMRTEGSGRLIAKGTNALASSIVLVCQKRDQNAPSVSRREFLRELKEVLSEAVETMIGGAEGISPVAPVDMAQAIVGPGMAVYSKYSTVLEADGSSMSVHNALILINRVLTEGGDEFDGDTQFCLGWFDEKGWSSGEFGVADVLARAKGTSVDGVREAGVVEAGSGKVRLLKPSEYPGDWSPEKDNRTPVWEALHQLIRALKDDGEGSAGALLARMPERAEPIRGLAYRLYTLCERKGWTEEARNYNEIIQSWLGIEAASHQVGHIGTQTDLGF